MFATVPILFGMMFSDMGHGLMLLAIAYFFKLGALFYMMAFMSCYCGLIYN
jgi:V-type H+-transporting ATPase subunit a